MGIIRVLGDEAGWSDKKIKRIEGTLDLLFIVLILYFGYLGVQQISMINECKDVIKCVCPYADDGYGENYTFTVEELNKSLSISSEIPIFRTSVED